MPLAILRSALVWIALRIPELLPKSREGKERKTNSRCGNWEKETVIFPAWVMENRLVSPGEFKDAGTSERSWPLPRTNSAKFVRVGSSVRVAGCRLPILPGDPHAMGMPLARLLHGAPASPDGPTGAGRMDGRLPWGQSQRHTRGVGHPRTKLTLLHPAGKPVLLPAYTQGFMLGLQPESSSW